MKIPSTTRLILGSVFGLLLALGPRSTAQTPADDVVTTAVGVYTAAQAARGEETYTNICVACPPAGTYTTAAFREKWHSKPLSELFALVSETMPKQEPASLTPKEYVEVLAYLLKING